MVDGADVFIVTVQVGNGFPLNAREMANIVGFLMPSPKQFAWETIQTQEEF